MSRKIFIIWFSMIGLSLLLGACSTSKKQTNIEREQINLHTAAVHTVIAEQTQQASDLAAESTHSPQVNPALLEPVDPVNLDTSAWQLFEDLEWGFHFNYPDDWVYKEIDTNDPYMPPNESWKRELLFMPAAVAEAMDNRNGPPEPDDPPLFPALVLDVDHGSLEEYRRMHVEPDSIEHIAFIGAEAVLEYCGYGTLCYVFQAPADETLRITLTDMISGFPERAEGGELMMAQIQSILETFRFLPQVKAPQEEVDESLLEEVQVIEPEAAPEAPLSHEMVSEQVVLNNLFVVFEDDFSSRKGWVAYKAADFSFEYNENGYRIYNNTYNDVIWSIREHERSEVYLQIEARQIGGPTSGYYGLTCRYQDSRNYYALVFGTDGFYGIARRLNNELAFLGQGKMESSGLISSGNMTNLVRGECVGDSLILFANDHKLLEVKDNTFASGYYGLVVGTLPEPGVDILFEKFTYLKP